MKEISEFKKLLAILLFFIRNVIVAIVSDNKDAKLFLSKIYLKYLYSKSVIPTTKIVAKEELTLTFSSFIINDEQSNLEERFTYQTLLELSSILYLLKSIRPQLVFEFGLLKGGSLYHFFNNTENDVQIVSIDITDEFLAPMSEKIISKNSRVKFYRANSHSFDFKPYYRVVNFILIDGGHDYVTVKNDSANALKMIAEGGIIVWDDYNPDFPGVFNAINELHREGVSVEHVKDTSLVIYRK